ncbi:Putative serine esterase (DUF676) [Musa troglodytarum]|uniref:Serine esterase (DUF676) n=1 Tax=Musa troglodytarum TaxID=320322 RepID=A0A9E7IAL4_9LILI|nr:Putative serine esterase (DUF676) [Musa troglodytarum]
MASMAPAVMSRHSIRTRREAPSRSIEILFARPIPDPVAPSPATPHRSPSVQVSSWKINDTRRRPIRLPICLGLPPAPLFSQD